MPHQTPDEIEDLLANFKLPSGHGQGTNACPIEKKAVTLWLLPEEKEKYDRLQERSSGEFRALLHEIVIRSINQVAQDL